MCGAAGSTEQGEVCQRPNATRCGCSHLHKWVLWCYSPGWAEVALGWLEAWSLVICVCCSAHPHCTSYLQARQCCGAASCLGFHSIFLASGYEPTQNPSSHSCLQRK